MMAEGAIHLSHSGCAIKYRANGGSPMRESKRERANTNDGAVPVWAGCGMRSRAPDLREALAPPTMDREPVLP
jgi:hypothetical protein